MSEETTSPFPPSPPPPPPPDRGGWWFAWIVATVIAPGAALPIVNGLPPGKGTEVFCWTGVAVILILHIVSAIKLGKAGTGCLTVGLIFGGWLLMLASFFVGCLVTISIH